MSHIQIWSFSGFRSLSSLAHAAQSSYLMLANYWHSHILWEIAENSEQSHSQCWGLGFRFLAPPASVRIQTQLYPKSYILHPISYILYPAGLHPDPPLQRPEFLIPCCQPAAGGTRGAQNVAVPKVLEQRCQPYPAQGWLTVEGLCLFCSAILWDNPYSQRRVFQNSVPVLCVQTIHSQIMDYLSIPGWRGRHSVSTHLSLTSHRESNGFFLVFYSGFFLRSQ